MKRAYRMEAGLTRAWAIYRFNEDAGEYLFHSAHWSKTRARELSFDWKVKLVKIEFVISA